MLVLIIVGVVVVVVVVVIVVLVVVDQGSVFLKHVFPGTSWAKWFKHIQRPQGIVRRKAMRMCIARGKQEDRLEELLYGFSERLCLLKKLHQCLSALGRRSVGN